MMKLGDRSIVQKSRPSSNLVVIAPPGERTPKNVALGYDVGKISAGCLVLSAYKPYLSGLVYFTGIEKRHSAIRQ